jgi:hypothetical protein
MESINFPDTLNIQPSSSGWSQQKDNLDVVADRQHDAIQRFGIAGIVSRAFSEISLVRLTIST